MTNRSHRSRNANRLLLEIGKGSIAGAVATWAMGRVTSYLYEQESRPAQDRDDAAPNGNTAYGVAVEKAAATAGMDLSEPQRERYGAALHWGLGIVAGAVYRGVWGRLPAAAAGRGLLYGAAFWAIVDEGANVALGLTPGPAPFPWQTHVRGLTRHLAFGVAADTTLRALGRVA